MNKMIRRQFSSSCYLTGSQIARHLRPVGVHSSRLPRAQDLALWDYTVSKGQKAPDPEILTASAGKNPGP